LIGELGEFYPSLNPKKKSRWFFFELSISDKTEFLFHIW
jgi:hypothetical protein